MTCFIDKKNEIVPMAYLLPIFFLEEEKNDAKSNAWSKAKTGKL